MPSSTTLAALRAFVEARDWDQFHSPENLAKSIAIEASELLEVAMRLMTKRTVLRAEGGV